MSDDGLDALSSEQLHDLGGCEMAAALGAVSVDHCDYLTPAAAARIARRTQGQTVAVLLPLAARRILDRMPPRQGWEVRAAMAAAGLALVVLAEIALGVALEASGIAEARAPRSPAERSASPRDRDVQERSDTGHAFPSGDAARRTSDQERGRAPQLRLTT